jgi:hypothetical protein
MSRLSDLSQRDKRALMLLAAVVVAVVAYRYLFLGSDDSVGGIDSVPLAERKLNNLRHIAAGLPLKETTLKQVEAELDAREKTVLSAGTAAQAQAKLLEVVRRVGNANGVEIRGGDFLTPKTLSDAYGEVFAGVTFSCGIDQFVNFFSGLSHEPDLLAPSELTMNALDQKNKALNVRMILSGVVPRKLVPEKKGYGL